MTFRQITILSLGLVTVAIVGLINFIQLGGQTTLDVIYAHPNSLTPYIVTQFAWIMVLVGVITFALYQALPEQKEKKYLDYILPWFFVGSVAAILCVFAWHLGYVALSPLILLVLLGCLVAIHVSLYVYRPEPLEFTFQDKLFAYLPLSFFYGWIVVVFTSNVANALMAAGVEELLFANQIWAAIIMIFLGVLGMIILIFFQDLPFGAALTWGLFGIYSNDILNTQVQIGFWISMAFLLVGSGIAVYQWSRLQEQNKPTDYF